VTRLAVRPPAVAGTFYPADPDELRRWIAAALEEATRRCPAPAEPPKAIVAPHAGYVYSGPIAATAYARVARCQEQIERVVLLGPAHRAALQAVAAPAVDAFATPLGLVPIDTVARQQLVDRGRVVISDAAHAVEHSLEVHLPFLQVTLPGVAVLPLAVADVPADGVADVLDHIWGGSETLVVVSTDLSHHYDYATVAALDRETATAIVARRPEPLRPEQACGAYPLRGLLTAARRRGLGVELLDLRSSGDTAGPRDRVVGYGAFAIA
jgi:hypothetical protein